VWSYIPLEQRALRAMVDAVLRELSPQFNQLYAKVGRPSIAPERPRSSARATRALPQMRTMMFFT
jgi:hypothetical protein